MVLYRPENEMISPRLCSVKLENQLVRALLRRKVARAFSKAPFKPLLHEASGN